MPPPTDAMGPGAMDFLGMGGAPAAQDPNAAQAQLEATIRQLRDLDAQVQSLVGQIPALGQEAEQMRTLIRRMIVKAAQAGQTQNSSAESLPMGA